MLNQLSIKNIAVIDKLEASFRGGVSVLTGETGAGKSIIIDSINMILGDRANKELVRYGADKAVVQAVFDVSDEVRDLLEDNGIDCDDGQLIITRQLTNDGKSTARINGMAVTLGVLRDVSDKLINIHGQHDNQALLTPARHIAFLDAYAENEEIIKEYKIILDRKRFIEKQLAALNMEEQEKMQKTDLLEYQINEIKKAALKKGEEEDLKIQRDICVNAERIANAVNEAYQNIYGGDETQSAYDGISVAANALAGIAKFDAKIQELYDNLCETMYAVEDAAHELKDFGDGIEYDEQTLNDIEERLEVISHLKRKYGASVEQVLEFAVNAQAELDAIKLSDERCEELKRELASVTAVLKQKGAELTERRAKYALALEKGIENALHELNMDKSRFKVSVESGPEFYDNGMDKVEFLISTNPGEPLKPLVKIASGGELSRVMLAIKSMLANADGVDTLIFDEIDTGVSGAAAVSIAKKLSIIGRNKQVICISHLPQLASMADNHYLIQKNMDGDMASTTLTELDRDGREAELARIIDGRSVTELALSHAREMLDNAENEKCV